MGIAVGLHLGIGKTGFNPTQPNSIEIIQAVDITATKPAHGQIKRVIRSCSVAPAGSQWKNNALMIFDDLIFNDI